MLWVRLLRSEGIRSIALPIQLRQDFSFRNIIRSAIQQRAAFVIEGRSQVIECSH